MATLRTYLPWIVATILMLTSAVLLWKYMDTTAELSSVREQVASSTQRIEALGQERDELLELSSSLEEALQNTEDKNERLSKELKSSTKQVRALERLAEMDPELLKKYSRVYFLNEHYVPLALADIDTKYRVQSQKDLKVHAEVEPFLSAMLADATAADAPILVVSAYRSFGTQADLKSSYTVRYGSGANAFSADQGYSEHQLGTTVDLTTPVLGTAFTSFGSTDAYGWLIEHAHEYGFILSYPKNNKYYQYEPWHWRFVGIRLATYLHENELSFYDIDQREIDEYLGTLFATK